MSYDVGIPLPFLLTYFLRPHAQLFAGAVLQLATMQVSLHYSWVATLCSPRGCLNNFKELGHYLQLSCD